MLAAERRSEMGVARAIGTRRGHLVEMFLFEGMAYDLIAAAVGAGLGVRICSAWCTSWPRHSATRALMSGSRSSGGARAGLPLGVLLTLLVVTVSAWRISRTEPRCRDPQPAGSCQGRKRRQWVLGAIGIGAGIMMTVGGVTGSQATLLLVGVSMVIVSLVTIVAALGVNERAAYTIGGLALVVWLLLPFSAYKAIAPDLSMDFSVWVANGLLVVIGTAWTIVYNADVSWL